MDRKKYIVEASDDVKKVMAMGVTHGGAIWTDTTDIENLEELNSDYINEHFGDLQDVAYQKGLEEGKTQNDIGCMGCAYVGLKESDDPCVRCSKCYKNQYRAKKKDDEIKVGDEVIYIEHKFIVFATETEEHYASLFDVNGNHASASQSKCKKTGRHFDIDKILEEMRE